MSKKINLIAYCGLFCADCPAFNGKIPDLAKELRRLLRKSRYHSFASLISSTSYGRRFKDYSKFYNVLEDIMKNRCPKGCRKGGGVPHCEILKCVKDKQYEGCWECDEFEDCIKLDRLKVVHGNAHMKNLRFIKEKGKEKFVEGKHLWYSKPK